MILIYAGVDDTDTKDAPGTNKLARALIGNLQPATLKNFGLVDTLRREIRQLERETGLEVDFQTDVIRLPDNVETGLYRIVHEAINNARKHTDTSRLQVSLNSRAGQVRVEVRDWGNGLDYDTGAAAGGWGVGLHSMRRRAELLQGTCDVQSIPGRGTIVCVQVPVSTS